MVFLKKRLINWMQSEQNCSAKYYRAKQAIEPGENNQRVKLDGRLNFRSDLS